MDEASLEAFYEQEYRQLYQGDEGPGAKDLAVQAGRARWLVEFARAEINALGRHLDIGSSAGLLLQHFAAEFSCQPVGIEPGNAYRRYAQEQGLTIYSSLDELSTNEKEKYNLVSMAHVLEHLPDPVSYLTTLRESYLSPDGWLLVEVPNLYGHDCFEIAHLVSYSPHTLHQVLSQAGYQIQTQRVHGQPRSEILPLYLTVLAKPALGKEPSKIEPESGVRRKRRFAMLHRQAATRLFPRKAWLPVPSEQEATA